MRRARKARAELPGARGGERELSDVRQMAKQMGSSAPTQFAKQPKGGMPGAFYAAPHAHVDKLVSEKEYRKALARSAHGKHDADATIARGGVYVPPTERK